MLLLQKQAAFQTAASGVVGEATRGCDDESRENDAWLQLGGDKRIKNLMKVTCTWGHAKKWAEGPYRRTRSALLHL